MRIISPKLIAVNRRFNIEFKILSEIKGGAGNFQVELIRHPRYIDASLCNTCGARVKKCPIRVMDPYNMGIVKPKAACIEYPPAVPLKCCIGGETCIFIQKGKCGGLCVVSCRSGSIQLKGFDKDHRFAQIFALNTAI